MLRVIVYPSLPETCSILTMDALLQRKPLTRQAGSTVQLQGETKGWKGSKAKPLGRFRNLKVLPRTQIPITKGDKDSLSRNSKSYTNIAKLCLQAELSSTSSEASRNGEHG